MKKYIIPLIAASFALSDASAATTVPVAAGATPSNWDQRDGTNLPNNWRIGQVVTGRTPSAAEGDLTIINGGRVIQVDTIVSTIAGEVRLNNSSTALPATPTQGNLEINSGGSLTMGRLRATGTDGGNLTVQGTGSLTTAAAEITMNSSFTIIGSNASFSATSFDAVATGILAFEFDTSGITTIGNTGLLTIEAGSLLNVDGTSYTGGADTFSLITATAFDVGNEVDGFNEFTEAITGFTGLNADVVYSASGVNLVLTAVPEPSTYALLAGLTGLGFVMMRRRK